MELNIYKCPNCLWEGNFTPERCPSCGYDLKAHREKIHAEMQAEAEREAERERTEQIEETYKDAIGLFNDGHFKEARKTFMSLGDYKDSVAFAEKCKEGGYQIAIKEFNKNSFLKNLISQEEPIDYFNTPFIQECIEEYSFDSFRSIKSIFEERFDGYKQSSEYIDYCDKAIDLFALYDQQAADYRKYSEAVSLYNDGLYEKALVAFQENEEILDSKDFIFKCQEAMYQHALQTLEAGNYKSALEEVKKIPKSKDKSAFAAIIEKCYEAMYQHALQSFNLGNYESALEEFEKIPEYKDASDYISNAQKEINRIERAQYIEKINQKAKMEAKQLEEDKKAQKVHIVVYLFNLIFCAVLGVILFINKEQISIISSFGWWFAGWAVFALISFFTFGSYLRKAMNKPGSSGFMLHRGAPKKAVIAMIVSLAVSVALIMTMGFGFNPTECVTVTATYKEDSIGGKYYDSVITFDLQNTSKYKVTYINGEMIFYNGETKVATYNVYFQGNYESGESYQSTLEFSEYGNSSLYDVSFENLKITYRVTSMKFNKDTEEREYKGKPITIKELS